MAGISNHTTHGGEVTGWKRNKITLLKVGFYKFILGNQILRLRTFALLKIGVPDTTNATP